jgi:high-affinity iron transporter
LAALLRERAPLSQVKASRDALDMALANAQALLTGDSAPAVVVANAGIIVFREGLEAVLILASLLGSFKAAEKQRYRRPMWLGAGLAFAASGLTWLVAQELLATLARYGERLEAVVSLLAIGVLLLITNWFFHKVYWTGWMANFHQQKRRILGADTSLQLGLLTLGFTSMYREGFESVLFLQALVLEGGTAVVLAGVALGLAATGLIGFLVFALQARLPHRKMLIFTGVLIGFVLLVMVGNTVHVWQVVGWLPIHPIRTLTLPYWAGNWFGLYPTWEGIIAPTAAAVFLICSYYIAE